MGLPFTVEQFLDVFARYNQAIWPLHLVAYALGLTAVALAWRPSAAGHRLIAAILAACWLWMGVVYHLLFFREINPAAIGFAALFVVEGLLFLWAGVARPRLVFAARADGYGLVGGLLVLYAMLIYPAIGAALGHGYPQSPSFGVAPCPTTIFTFGLLLWTGARVPKRLLVIPVLWALLGVSAATALGIREDLGLLAAGLVAPALLAWRDRRATSQAGLTARPT
jgi:hypothetical protein